MIKTVVCGISGGVDSAVSALLLKRKGFNVIGAFMKNWDLRDEVGHCTSEADAEDADYVCQHLNIPLRHVNFVKEYWNQVFIPMIEAYEDGMTPNPDVWCNRHIKFGDFHKHCIDHLGADAVATGHYARNSLGDFLEKSHFHQNASLLIPRDKQKDQTLFLCQIQQEALKRTMFPVGGLLKSEVKTIARESGLDKIANKKESMGICFIGSRYFHDFIEEYIEPKPGNFINIDSGKIVGHHKGVHYWTVGQRSHIGGLAKACFVVHLDPVSRNITVAEGTDHPALYTDSMLLELAHWINTPPQFSDGRLHCQFRFQNVHPLMNCVLEQKGSHLHLTLEHPLRAITPGQFAVFYIGEECIGSSKIIKPGPSLFEQNSLQEQTKQCR